MNYAKLRGTMGIEYIDWTWGCSGLALGCKQMSVEHFCEATLLQLALIYWSTE